MMKRSFQNSVNQKECTVLMCCFLTATTVPQIRLQLVATSHTDELTLTFFIENKGKVSANYSNIYFPLIQVPRDTPIVQKNPFTLVMEGKMSKKKVDVNVMCSTWRYVCVTVCQSLFLSVERSALLHILFRLMSVSCVSPAVFLPVSLFLWVLAFG